MNTERKLRQSSFNELALVSCGVGEPSSREGLSTCNKTYRNPVARTGRHTVVTGSQLKRTLDQRWKMRN